MLANENVRTKFYRNVHEVRGEPRGKEAETEIGKRKEPAGLRKRKEKNGGNRGQKQGTFSVLLLSVPENARQINHAAHGDQSEKKKDK